MESERVFRAAVPADPRFLHALRAFFRSVLTELAEDQAEKLVLALDECCSNLLKHAQCDPHGESLRVVAEFEARRVRFTVHDFCRAEDVSRIKPRELDEVRPGGLGTHFVAEIMDRVAYEPDPVDPSRMALVLEKVLPDGRTVTQDPASESHEE